MYVHMHSRCAMTHKTVLTFDPSFVGPNKVAFVIFNYQTRYLHNPGDEEVLLDRNLSERLKSQEALQQYLKEEQILSWTRVPLKTHVVKLICLAEKEKNPIPYELDHCVTL